MAIIDNAWIFDSSNSKIFFGSYDDQFLGVAGTPQEKWSLATSHQISSQKINQLKASKIIATKLEAANRISISYPTYKQSNILGAVSLIHNKEMVALKNNTQYVLNDEEKKTVNKAKACNEYILFVREKSNNLENFINEALTEDELDSIDVSNNIYWE